MRLALLAITSALAWPQAAPVLRKDTFQAGTPTYCRSTTGNDTYTCTLTPTLTAYTTGGCIVLNADTANTGTATVNVDTLGAKSILKQDGSALSDGDIGANKPKLICYDGTQYLIQGDGGGGGGSPGGSGTELQYRGGASTFSALANSSVPNAGELRLGTTPAASATRAVLTVGTAAIVDGSGNGNMVGISAPSGFNGRLMHMETDGVTRLDILADGTLQATNLQVYGSNTILNGYGLDINYFNNATFIKTSANGAAAAMTITGSAGTASTNYLALQATSGGTPTVQLRINGDQKAVMIGQTVNTTSLSAMTTYFSDRTATTGDTRVAIEGGAGQAADLFAVFAYNATPLAGTKHFAINSSGAISTGTWNGTVIGSSYGGAGTVSGLMKANGSGTVSAATAGTDYVSPSSSETLTNKTLDAEGTGNSITVPVKIWLPAATCQSTTGTINWDTLATNAPTATCSAGSTETTMMRGVADFPDADGDYSLQQTIRLPSDWTGNVDILFLYRTTATTGNTVWQVATACRADAEVDDVAYNAATALSADAAKGTTNQLNEASATSITMTGCAAGEMLHLKVLRNRTNASDTITGVVSLVGVELTLRRAM